VNTFNKAQYTALGGPRTEAEVQALRVAVEQARQAGNPEAYNVAQYNAGQSAVGTQPAPGHCRRRRGGVAAAATVPAMGQSGQGTVSPPSRDQTERVKPITARIAGAGSGRGQHCRRLLPLRPVSGTAGQPIRSTIQRRDGRQRRRCHRRLPWPPHPSQQCQQWPGGGALLICRAGVSRTGKAASG
jgi:hypothetical protein